MSDCERWIALSDRVAVEEEISSEDRVFLRAHESSCEECGREAKLYARLSTQLEGPRVTPIRNKRSYWVPAAALVAVAAGIAFFVWPREKHPETTIVIGPPSPTASVERGDIRSGERALASGDALAEGTKLSTETAGCVAVDPAIDLCLAKGSATLDRLSGDRVVSLESGSVVARLAKQAPGMSFSVATKAGTVRAVGTMFSVRVIDGGTRLVLHEGRVLVTRTGQAAQEIAAPASFDLVTGASGPIDPADDAIDDALLRAEIVTPAADAGITVVMPSARALPKANPDELLRQARTLRTDGKFKDAADVYRRITKESPSSAAGRSALVSLGDLDLGPLDDASGALGSFDAYLAQGPGSLETEAQLGRVKALRKLGRSAEEKKAIESFLAAHPDHIEAPMLKKRLEAP